MIQGGGPHDGNPDGRKRRAGGFAPKFAALNDDVLIGEAWSREKQLSLRDRSLITVTVLLAQGAVDASLWYQLENAGKKRRDGGRNR